MSTCSRCSNEAVVKRDSAFYCGKCAMARDWEEIIAVVQADRVERATVNFGSTPATVGTSDTPATVGASEELPADPFG